jgi:nucleoside-diphosphate-sugar epimerase
VGRARDELGWSAALDVREGIRRTYAAVADGRG